MTAKASLTAEGVGIPYDTLERIRSQLEVDKFSEHHADMAGIISELSRHNAKVQEELEYHRKIEPSCLLSGRMEYVIKTLVVTALIAQVVTGILALTNQEKLPPTAQVAIIMGSIHIVISEVRNALSTEQLKARRAREELKAKIASLKQEGILALMAFLQAMEAHQTKQTLETFKTVVATRKVLSSVPEGNAVAPSLDKLVPALVLADSANPVSRRLSDIYATATIEDREKGDKESQSFVRRRSSVRDPDTEPLLDGHTTMAPPTLRARSIVPIPPKDKQQLVSEWGSNWQVVDDYMRSIGYEVPKLVVHGVTLTKDLFDKDGAPAAAAVAKEGKEAASSEKATGTTGGAASATGAAGEPSAAVASTSAPAVVAEPAAVVVDVPID